MAARGEPTEPAGRCEQSGPRTFPRCPETPRGARRAGRWHRRACIIAAGCQTLEPLTSSAQGGSRTATTSTTTCASPSAAARAADADRSTAPPGPAATATSLAQSRWCDRRSRRRRAPSPPPRPAPVCRLHPLRAPRPPPGSPGCGRSRPRTRRPDRPGPLGSSGLDTGPHTARLDVAGLHTGTETEPARCACSTRPAATRSWS